MKKIHLIEKIAFLPTKFYDSKNNLSISSLLEKTGYPECHNEIEEDMIKKYLVKFPQAIECWFSWSDNKRTNNGYYFLRKDSVYIVGLLDSKGKIVEENKYKNVEEACANFIKKEIENIMAEKE